MAAGLTDFIFGDDTKVGDTIVIPSDNGAYVAIPTTAVQMIQQQLLTESLLLITTRLLI